MAEAIFASWRLDLRLLGLLLAASWLYVRGWRKLHLQSPHKYSTDRLAAFLAGLSALFVALASPLDAFGGLLLEVHMVQHLLLIMVAPALIWLGQPVIPMLRGLPPRFLKTGLGPFLAWHGLRRAGRLITHPVVTWLAMTFAIVFWHMPRWYELGLESTAWHQVEHACFFGAALLFWWPVIDVWPGRAQWPRWMMIPYLVLADIVNTALSAWLVFSTQVVYRTYELAPRLGGISALSDQSTAGAIMWVPGSIVYLIPACAITIQMLTRRRLRPAPPRIKPFVRQDSAGWDLLRLPAIGAVLRYRYFRRAAQGVLFALAVAIVVDGLAGPQIAPMNLAGVLPWTYWRGFAVIALLAGGNFFCMVCPFMLPREIGRRLLPARHRWPGPLRSKWFAAALLAAYLWAYEAFGLWASPWWTAWIVVGYFLTAFLIDGLFQGASFCKYICPIGQFHFVNSLVSPFEVKVKSGAVCDSCRTYDCIRGNATHRGCELQLFQPRKSGNFDCTFCLDCVQACPQDNVGVLAVIPGKALIEDRRSSGIGQLSRRPDAAALAMVLVFGALVNAAAMVDPVMQWMHLVHRRLGLESMLPVVTLLYAGGVLFAPAILAFVCSWSSRSMANCASEGLGAGRASWKDLACNFAWAMVPLGLAMWVAHFLFHLLTGWRSLEPVLGRIFHFAGFAINLSAEVPGWLPPVQVLLLDAGLLFSLYIAWRTACRRTMRTSQALGLVAPWAMLAIGFYAAAVWILFQPMQMRGMVM